MAEMILMVTGWRAALSGFLVLVLAGCSGPIDVYHNIEGGAIAQNRQAPPGAELPYPNLADVPSAPAAPAPGAQATIAAQARGTAPEVLTASPDALAGLDLPTAPPPPPGIAEASVPAGATAIPAPSTSGMSPAPPPAAPVAFAFPTGSAVLPVDEISPLQALAGARAQARLRVGGFGDDASLALALARARRLADALTAAGAPPNTIDLCAAAAGSGGFVQLVY